MLGVLERQIESLWQIFILIIGGDVLHHDETIRSPEWRIRRQRLLLEDVEDRTDRMALTAYDRLDDEQLQQLLDALAPLARAVIATGDIPEVTPIGQRFNL